MTKKERIKAVINGNIPDATPYYIDLTGKGKEKLSAHYGIETALLNEYIGNQLLFLKFSAPEGFIPEKAGDSLFKDEFGVTWDMGRTNDVGDWGMVEHPVKDMEVGSYRFPKAEGKGRFRDAERIVKENPENFNLLQMVGLCDRVWQTTGIQDFLMGMALDADFTNRMLDMALEYNLGIIEQLPEYIDGIRFIEDWGDQKCLMMGADNWRRYLKPRLKEMYKTVKGKGCAVFIHSCGNITELFRDIIEIGVDAVDPIQPEVMDIKLLKREYGKDIVLFGGLGCQSTIPLGTPEQVVDEAREVLSFMAEGGKFILGPSGAIPTEAPVENLAALIKYCKETMENNQLVVKR